MARYKPQEIVRRDAIPSRRAERPILAVHADQEPTRYAGSLVKVVGGGIQMLGDIYSQRMAQKNAKQAEEDFNRGADMRRKEELSGEKDKFREHILEAATEHYKRGYYKTDGMLKIRNWTAETALQLMQAEPDEDYATLVQASKSELLQHPAFQDPQTRQDMLAMLDKADYHLYTQRLEGAAKEMLTRQEEAMSALIRDRIDSGEPLTNETFDNLYALLDQEDYGYLNKRHVDELVSNQIVESLAAGREDYAQIIEFLETRKDANGVSLMDGQQGSKLRKAVEAGRHQLEARAKAARDQAYADAYFDLDREAQRGMLTQDRLTEWADRLGLEGNKRREFFQQWNNRQRQTEERWAREAALRRQEAIARESYERNPWGLPEKTIQKFLDEKWEQAGNDEIAQSAVIAEAIAKGVVPSFIENFLQRGGYGDGDLARRQNALYQDLRARDPGFAAQAAGKRNVFYDILQDEVERGGHPIEPLLERMGATRRTQQEAEHVANTAWRDLAKQYPEIEVNGQTFELTDLDQFRIRRRFQDILTNHPGVTAEEAWKAARNDEEVRKTHVNGKVVSRDKLPPGGEAMVEAYLQSVAHHTGMPLDSLAAQPSPGTAREWIVTSKTGFPIADPDTGALVVFGTDEMMGYYTDWNGGRDLALTHSSARAQEISRLRGEERTLQVQIATGRGLPRDADNKLRAIQQRLDTLVDSPDPAADHTNQERRLSQLKAELMTMHNGPGIPDVERQRAIIAEIDSIESARTTGGVTDDFYTYVKSVRGY